MRDRPFISGAEAPRKYSDIRAERAMLDPIEDGRAGVRDQIDRLEGEARVETDPIEAKRLQCEAEALRCALDGK